MDPIIINNRATNIDYYNSTIVAGVWDREKFMKVQIYSLTGIVLKSKDFKTMISNISFTHNGNVIVCSGHAIYLLNNNLDVIWLKNVSESWCNSYWCEDREYINRCIHKTFPTHIAVNSSCCTINGEHYFICTEDGSIHILDSNGDYLRTIDCGDAVSCKPSMIYSDRCVVIIDPSRYEPDPELCGPKYNILCSSDGSSEDTDEDGIVMIDNFGLVQFKRNLCEFVDFDTKRSLWIDDEKAYTDSTLTKDGSFFIKASWDADEVQICKSPFYRWSPATHFILNADVKAYAFMMFLLRDHTTTVAQCLPNEILFEIINYLC